MSLDVTAEFTKGSIAVYYGDDSYSLAENILVQLESDTDLQNSAKQLGYDIQPFYGGWDGESYVVGYTRDIASTSLTMFKKVDVSKIQPVTAEEEEFFKKVQERIAQIVEDEELEEPEYISGHILYGYAG